MGPFGVVDSDPLADDLFGLEAVRQVVQVDQEADIAVPALDPRSLGGTAIPGFRYRPKSGTCPAALPTNNQGGSVSAQAPGRAPPPSPTRVNGAQKIGWA